MPKYLKIDTSYRCALRTTRKILLSQAVVSGPQLLLEKPLPNRQLLRIFNNGLASGFGSPDVLVVVGDVRIRWPTLTDFFGYGMQRLEFVDLPIDENIAVYGLLDPTRASTDAADLRLVEFS